MANSTHLDLLRRLRDATARASELELADLDRQIVAHERGRPRPVSIQTASARKHEQALLRVMQEAGPPLPPREIAQRLGVPPATASRWLDAAMRRGFIERVGHARYQIKKEVPPL